jgi:exodeoxyribonuclease V alpha subunit
VKLSGEVKQIGKKTGYIQTEEKKVKIRSSVYFNGLKAGDTVQLEGDFQGDVFQVTEFELQGFDGVASLLSQIPGVSASVAEEIASSLDIKAQKLLKAPEHIYEVATLSDNMKDHIHSELKHLSQRAGFVKLSGYLQKYGVDAGTIYKVFAHFDSSLNAVEQIKRNPYMLVLVDTDKNWFSKMDKMASDLGTYAIDSDMRKFAKIISILLAEEKGGHCYTRWGRLAGKLVSELKDLPYEYTREEARQDITRMLKYSRKERDKRHIPREFHIICEENRSGKPFRMIYRKSVFFSERDSARYISVNGKATTPPAGLTAWLKKRQEESEKPESKEQISAVNMFWHNSISILTGGPGTGKTHAIGAILASIKNLSPGSVIQLAAPTGRAARRMTEMLGHEARTIHSLLYGSSNRPEADVAIIDETSMTDIITLNTLLKSLKPNARILFVGDSDQLPSVQPGNVLQDMLASGVPHVRLSSKNFRSVNTIVKNAHRIISGNANLFYDSKFELIAAGTTDEMLEAIKRESIAPDAQVLTSRRDETDISAEKLNQMLRAIINPGPVSPEKNFRCNDKIICVKNNWDNDKFISNGEIGTVVDVELDGKGGIRKVLTKFNGSDRLISWNWIEANVYLEFAYAITTHKSQGSEYDTVIIPMPEDDKFTNINLFYTAVTRAKNKVVLIGKKERIEQILTKMPHPRRTNFTAAINAYRERKSTA